MANLFYSLESNLSINLVYLLDFINSCQIVLIQHKLLLMFSTVIIVTPIILLASNRGAKEVIDLAAKLIGIAAGSVVVGEAIEKKLDKLGGDKKGGNDSKDGQSSPSSSGSK